MRTTGWKMPWLLIEKLSELHMKHMLSYNLLYINFYLISLARFRKDIYSKQGEVRKIEQARTVETKIAERIEKANLSLPSKEKSNQIVKSWEDATTEDIGRKQLLKKYTVDEIYEIILDIGKEFLPPDKLLKFVEKLTKRLRG